jgi:hypothetical protein
MSSLPALTRTVLSDGSVSLRADRCEFRYQRLRPGALLVTIDGCDQGQFGPATVDEIAAEFTRTSDPLRLYVDTSAASGPTTAVMETWTAWLAANRPRLARVVVLVSPESKLLHLTVSIAQHLSRTGELLQICGDADEFRRAVEREATPHQRNITP